MSESMVVASFKIGPLDVRLYDGDIQQLSISNDDKKNYVQIHGQLEPLLKALESLRDARSKLISELRDGITKKKQRVERELQGVIDRISE